MQRKLHLSKTLLFAGMAILLGLTLLGLGVRYALARPAAAQQTQGSPLHPTFAFLDQNGENVLQSGKPVSTMKTCGSCHDTDFIASHSYHADAGLEDMVSQYGADPQSSNLQLTRPWDTSPGIFGRWDPIFYRYLSPTGQAVDLSTPEWLKELGQRHAGGGPAITSRSGTPLLDLAYQAGNPETNIRDPQTGQLTPWDWSESGVVEMNCFLCHITQPDNRERIAALQAGNFGWANTATLQASGLVSKQGDSYVYNSGAFDENGQIKPEYVNIQDPTNQNCGQCHGLVHDILQEPLVVAECSAENYRTVTTGQIISPEHLHDSGMNLENKKELDRTWDVHAERQVSCTDCHFSLNNPVYYQPDPESNPEHLTFDPRRLELGEYLLQPLHEFARGASSQSNLDPELKGTMRRCESCHSIENTHNWLPYKERHTAVMDCESCHIPKIYSTAMQQQDWTVIRPASTQVSICRGAEGNQAGIRVLIKGYEPVLLLRQTVNGDQKLAPFNLVSSWYWVYDNPVKPVPLSALQAVYLEGEAYQPDIISAFDRNQDGQLEDSELVIDNEEKRALVSTKLKALGYENPQILGDIQPYSINHTVTHGEWATRDCQTCHSSDSRITQSFKLANYVPAGVTPDFVNSPGVFPSGKIVEDETGALYYQPDASGSDKYILGYSSVGWIDLGGSLIFLGVMMAIMLHSGLRFYSTTRKSKGAHAQGEIKQVYMYSTYERLWHWLQTFTILGLLFTGLIIHKPDTFGIFGFRGVVLVHNTLAFILVANAFLSLFYHLASGEIKQYLPRPQGFIDQAVQQAIYYTRGIFKGEAHPFEKTPDKKLNPLQQITYFGLLNILLPLQIITGILMWGVQRWPDLTAALGGLTYLAPFHTLIAWLFAAFIVAHVYLTTTGHEPLTSIKAMMIGWDEVEVPGTQVEGEASNAGEGDTTESGSPLDETAPQAL